MFSRKIIMLLFWAFKHLYTRNIYQFISFVKCHNQILTCKMVKNVCIVRKRQKKEFNKIVLLISLMVMVVSGIPRQHQCIEKSLVSLILTNFWTEVHGKTCESGEISPHRPVYVLYDKQAYGCGRVSNSHTNIPYPKSSTWDNKYKLWSSIYF